jgi:hypothetical protein
MVVQASNYQCFHIIIKSAYHMQLVYIIGGITYCEQISSLITS